MVRLLVAAGVQAVGIDPVEARCRLAEKAGAASRAPPTTWTPVSGLAAITGGRGADHIFLAAGGNTNGPVEAAVKLARDRARVVDIGKMKLDLPWNAYYEKELDVRFSRSYGPGRYDDRYELEGIDYPAGTSAGPRSATWSPSWNCSPAAPLRWRPSSTGSSRSTRPRRSTAT